MMRKPVIALLAAIAVTVPVHSANPDRPTIIMRQSPSPAAAPLPDPAAIDRIARARTQYEALLRGVIGVGDLGPQDLQDVLDFDRMVRGGGLDNRSFAQRCVDDEVQRLNGRPSELAWRVIELKCREVGG